MQNQFDEIDLSISVIALIFSAIALIPTIYSFARRYLFRIDAHDVRRAAVYFSLLGSGLSLPVTLRAAHFDPFITNVKISVKSKSGAERELQMLTERKEILVAHRDLSGGQKANLEIQAELAQPFLLHETAPRRMDIMCVAPAEHQRLQAIARRLQQICLEIKNASTTQEEYSKLFAINGKVKAIHTKAKSELFWEATDYEATLIITTSKPTRIFRYKFSFSLTEEDIVNLTANTALSMQEVAGLGIPPQNIAQPYIVRH